MSFIRKLLSKRPKLGDNDLLAVFYYCDQAVNQQMEQLNYLMRTSPDNLGRRSVLIRQLKEAQHNLMNIILCIVQQAIPADQVASRDYRVKYPDDVLLDQINGPIWFGAECIAAGSHIANHEDESMELRPYAIQVSKCVSKVRQALREHRFSSRVGYSQKLKDLLLLFDGLWADFEFRYVSLMCSVKTEEQYYQQQEVVVLFCESTIRALQKKYLSHEMIEMMDPVAMFAIPRLAIVCGLIVYPDGPLDTSKLLLTPFFKAYKQLLTRIKELLGYLSAEQLTALETSLCTAEGFGTLDRSKKPSRSIKPIQTTERPISGEPSSIESAEQVRRPTHQRSRSYDLDSRSGNRTIFEPQPNGSNTIEEPNFPNLGVETPVINDLRSNSATNSHGNNTANELMAQSDAATVTKQQPTTTPAVTRQKVAKKSPRKNKGPAGFSSAEDLMHRLYVAISGVADQLQTNHAKDLRVILKDVFTVCQSEPEALMPCKDGRSLLEPCTPESQSPLIAQTISFPVATSLSLEEYPSWVPDAESPICSTCQENFSWRKRRHHCRNCGNVVCSRCSPNTLPLPRFGIQKPVRVCTNCYIQHLGRAARMASFHSQSMQVH